MRQIPQIQQQPRAASDTAPHYAYCAFKDIFVGDRKLQPEGSPYAKTFPAREVIPFTNLSIGVCITDVLVGGEPIGTLNASHAVPNLSGKPDPTVVMQPKTARECAEELLSSYEDWGYKVLTPLTGYSEADVFAVMQTIQPLPYKLRDLVEALETAEERIAATEPYGIGDDELSIELNPLSPELKTVARAVLPIIESAVKLAEDKAREIVADTTQKLEQFYSGQGGKRKADPLDHYVFAEMAERIPSRLTTEPKNNDDAIDRLANALSQNSNIAAKESELDAKRAELDALMEQARALIAASQPTPPKTKTAKTEE
jgi:hypothetical protein